MKLRTHILLLVVATVVPMTLFAAALIFYNARLQQQAAERGMRDTARALALALDREIHDITTGVQTLAASRHLDDPPDLRRFYEEAVSVSRSFGGWAVLSDPAGRQFFNTLRPSAEGFLEGKGLSDEDVYAAYKRSSQSGWVVAVAAPASAVEAPFRRSLLALSAGGAVLLAVASVLAYVLSNRITTPIVALAESLKRSSDLTPTPASASTVEEIEELRRALEEATRHRIAGEALREADRRKDEFLAMVSHELRHPLNAMLGWLRLLRGGTLDAPATRRGLDVIERSVHQQGRLISDLLDVSRIVAGKLTLKMEPVDLPALVGGVVESSRPTFDAKS